MDSAAQPFKKRKVIRKRPTDDSDDEPSATSTCSAKGQDLRDAEVIDPHEKNPLVPRVIKGPGHCSRRGGLGYSSNASLSRPEASTTQTARQKTVDDNLILAANRFVAPTGETITLDNKHMTAYVDSQLASLARPSRDDQARNIGQTITSKAEDSSKASHSGVNRYHGTFSHVQEVELPSTAPRKEQTRAQDDTMTTGQSTATDPLSKRRGKARVSKKGTYIPRRRRNQRTQDDVARDALVEQVLSESRLENVYDPPATSTAGIASTTAQSDLPRAGNDHEADLRLADEFRNRFMAEAEERNLRRRMPAASVAKGKRARADAPARGPKLGGSRQQRAAMRAAAEEAKTKK